MFNFICIQICEYSNRSFAYHLKYLDRIYRSLKVQKNNSFVRIIYVCPFNFFVSIIMINRNRAGNKILLLINTHLEISWYFLRLTIQLLRLPDGLDRLLTLDIPIFSILAWQKTIVSRTLNVYLMCQIIIKMIIHDILFIQHLNIHLTALSN